MFWSRCMKTTDREGQALSRAQPLWSLVSLMSPVGERLLPLKHIPPGIRSQLMAPIGSHQEPKWE